MKKELYFTHSLEGWKSKQHGVSCGQSLMGGLTIYVARNQSPGELGNWRVFFYNSLLWWELTQSYIRSVLLSCEDSIPSGLPL